MSKWDLTEAEKASINTEKNLSDVVDQCVDVLGDRLGIVWSDRLLNAADTAACKLIGAI